MSEDQIETIDMAEVRAGGRDRERVVAQVGRALQDIGFFAVKGHGVEQPVVERAYDVARRFFALPEKEKARFEEPRAKAQRGYTSFGKEKAKDASSPDLKEFFQVGRTDVPDSHPVHRVYGGNIWPDEVVPGFQEAMTALWESLEVLGRDLLVLAAEHAGLDPRLLAEAVHDGDTILRVIHYPPVGPDAPPESIRASAHEDINFITLLCGATDDGLELLRRDGTWMPIKARHGEIVVDSGDMLQNLTNGLYRSTTHRVVRPRSERSGEPRFSMPLFVHPRADVDLTPNAACVQATGGAAKYPSITAGEYLQRRLKEIGVG